MPTEKRSDTVRALFAAYLRKDRGFVENVLTDDFRFTSPYDDNIDRATYFERCWPNSERMRDIDVERVCVAGDGAFVTYKVATRDGRVFRNTEFMTFAGERIRRVDVYFGAGWQDGVFLDNYGWARTPD
jgi:ketosteroid isomerase-like protein